MKNIRDGSWLDDLVNIYSDLGGQADYSEVYELARVRRLARGATWTPQSPATIRRTVEDHAKSSSNYRGDPVFYSVDGHGSGTWALLPQYISVQAQIRTNEPSYLSGMEGIMREHRYLMRSRDAKLVEARRVKDDHTCQVCGFRLEVKTGKFIIEVHHLKPLGSFAEATVTRIEDLVCLCPTCHRIAHSRPKHPLSVTEIKAKMHEKSSISYL